MKKISMLSWLLLSLLLTQSLVAKVSADHVTIKGEAVGLENNRKIYLQRYENKMFFTIDSTKVFNGKFSFNANLRLPELYGITDDTTELFPLFVFIQDTKEIVIRYDTSKGGRSSTITGSPAADHYKEYQRKSRNLNIEEFIKAHPASIVSAWVLYRYFSSNVTPEDIEHNTNLLDKSLENTQYVQLLRALPETLRERKLGTQAPDFSLPTPDGKVVKLSDHFGKYLLVDFWAAWCVPCRRENPNIVRVYNKYKDKGFSVIGISLDSKREAWIKAIAQDNLPWTQVSDLLFWHSAPAKLYGIRTIPGNVLLDPSGKIIARNVRGEELEKKIASLLQ